MGWNISGIPKVTRTNKSYYYDGKAVGITQTKEDAFILDGMRLIETGRTSVNIRYESEQGHIRAIAYLNGAVLKYFEVLYPNGNKGVFGYTGNTSTHYLEYPLTSLTDLQGNTISYSYTYSNSRYLISAATYGDNGGASIEFSYQSGRTDPVSTYRGGLMITEDKLLQKINCKYGSTVLHSYGLEYANERSCAVINKITYTAGSESFNPLVFSYGTGAYQSDYDQSTTQLYEWYVTGDNPGQVTIVKGKFDYGSDDDGLISYPTKYPYWHHYRNPTWIRKRQNRYDNLFTGDEKIFFYAGLKDEMASPMPSLTTGTGFITIFCANVDGKYEEEVVKVNNVVSGSNDQLTFKAYTPNLYTGLSLKYTRTYNFPTVLTDEDGGKSIHPKYYFAGDFNGNGKMEVLAVSNHHPLGDPNRTSKCYLFDLESNSKLYEGYVFPHMVDFVGVNQTDPDAAFQNTDRLFVLDYDGDGKSDVCHINDQGINIYTFDINGTSYSMRKVATYTGLKKPGLAGRSLLPGEFDGDGLIDLLVSPQTGYGWEIYHSTGDGQFYKTTFSGTANSTGANNGFLLQDVNGDGLTDLIKYSSSGFFTYLTKNGTPSSSEDYESKPNYSVLVPTNINSRNVFNQLIAIKDGVATKFRFQRDDTRERMLSSAVNSLGVVYQNHYQKLNDESSSFYSKGAGANYPFENFNGPLWAISTQGVWLDAQKKESTSYSYHNAVIHKQGLGFRGFEKISAYDNIRYRSSSSEINPYNYSVPVKDETHFARNTYEYSVSVLSDKRLKVLLNQRTAYDKINNTTTVSTYTHDTYGNVLTQTDSYPGSITVKNTNIYSNSTSDAAYLLGFLYDLTTKTTRGTESSSVRQYIQNHSKGLPIKVITYIDGNKTGEVNYTYDSFGKVESAEKQRFSSVFLTTNYDYDNFGHLVSETDPMGFTSTWHYNTGGLLDYSTNYKDHQTDYSYDEFGRLKTTTSPLDFVAETTYEWDAAGTGGLYTITQTSTGQATQKTWYDAFGREVRQAVQRFDELWAKTDTKHDNYGRVEKSSLPFTGSDATYWATYVYDGYDRPLSVTEASGKKTTHSYNGYKVSTTSEGITTGRTYDALGSLVESEDPGGTITYNLRPDGQPSSIEAPGGVTTGFSYDQYGRQKTMNDPSAGLVTYDYDLSGNLKQQIDAEGRAMEMEYDDYGRIITKSSPEMTTDYNYKPNDNLLESKTSSNGTSTVYDYDTYGRLTYVKETGADGLWLSINYYHSLVHGNLFGIIYKTSGGETFNEQYLYNFGHRTEIKLGTTSIWKLTAQNALGQPTGATTGPVTRAYSFDDYGLPTGRSAGAILDAGYGFETVTGNLLNRKDKKRNKTENFLYDGLNRLTNFGSYTAGYDTNGNLLGKTDAGTFYYNTPDKPYAMSGADLTSNAVPQRHQQINYTSFKQPHDISENNHLATFTYNAEGQRVKMELKENGQVKLVRHYLGGCYEKDMGVGGTKEKLYLGGDYYSAPAVYVKQGSGNWQLYYICRDYLGSITHLASSTGSLTQELSFDAWGRLRNPVTQTAYDPGSEPALFLGRGYTGHEHLPEFGLINMNGRLYDPAVGRFLSPDNFVQLPDNTQNFNRYSYALNNPLKYTDPDGEWFFSLIFPGVGTVIDVFLWSATIDYATQAITNYVTREPGETFNDWAWKDIDWLDVGVSGGAGVATMGLDKVYKAGKISKTLYRAGQVGINAGLPAISARYDWKPASDGENFSVNRGDKFWIEYSYTVVKQYTATQATNNIIKHWYSDKPWALNNNPVKKQVLESILDLPASVGAGWWSNKYYDSRHVMPEPPQVPLLPEETPLPDNWWEDINNYAPNNQDIQNSLQLNKF